MDINQRGPDLSAIPGVIAPHRHLAVRGGNLNVPGPQLLAAEIIIEAAHTFPDLLQRGRRAGLLRHFLVHGQLHPELPGIQRIGLPIGNRLAFHRDTAHIQHPAGLHQLFDQFRIVFHNYLQWETPAVGETTACRSRTVYICFSMNAKTTSVFSGAVKRLSS